MGNFFSGGNHYSRRAPTGVIDSPDIDGFANELAKSDGFVVVFTSSTGKELSIEKKEWGYGAFTMALLEGLSGKAANEKRVVSIARLNDYVADRVKALTEGKQHPTFINPDQNTNPAIAALK